MTRRVFCDRCGYTWDYSAVHESTPCGRCHGLGHVDDWRPLMTIAESLGGREAAYALPPASAAPYLRGADDQLRRAEALARCAHAGDKDKAGRDYYEAHLLDVLRRVQAYGGDLDEQAAALLHDIIEDTDVTEEDLVGCGFSDKVVLCVDLMTKREGERHEVYFARLRAYEPARRLKLEGDVASNSDPARAALLGPEAQQKYGAKYAEAADQLRPRPRR